MKKYIVYIHIFPNEKTYIGITSQKPEYRWRNGKKYDNNKYMKNAIKKYGWENIKHIILYTDLTKEQAEQKESELIKQYKSNNRLFGYNILNGGNIAKGMSREMIEKMRKDRKGKHYSPRTEFKKGHKPWTTGKKMNDEFKEKLSKGHLGQIAWNRRKIICLETNKVYESIKKASEELNVKQSGISKVCRGIMKQTGNFHFKYYDENKKSMV